MFNEQDPDVIAEKMLTGLNNVVKEFITIKMGSTHMDKATMAKYSEEGVDV